MVIIKIWGGLGNQLFQYSFGKYVAARLGTSVKYDIQTTNSLNNFVQRDLALSCFNVRIDTATVAEVNEKKYFQNITLARLERKIAQQFPFLFKQHVVEPNSSKPAAALQVTDNCYYEGYWQSYKYLEPVESLLRQEYRLKQLPGKQVADVSKEIDNSVSASIHVRRSDYLTHANFVTCDMQYYEKAIAHIKQATAATKFFIFSDDIPWCKQNFIGPEFIFIDGNKHYEDLYLMSKCSHNIIANSTFSWWGAWLNINAGKIVIAPAHWHRKKDGKNNDLLPESWIQIE